MHAKSGLGKKKSALSSSRKGTEEKERFAKKTSLVFVNAKWHGLLIRREDPFRDRWREIPGSS